MLFILLKFKLLNTFYLYKTSHQGSFARSLKVLKGEVFVGCVFFLHSFASLLYEKNDHHQMQAAIWCCLLDRRPAFYFQFGQFAKKLAEIYWRPPKGRLWDVEATIQKIKNRWNMFFDRLFSTNISNKHQQKPMYCPKS